MASTLVDIYPANRLALGWTQLLPMYRRKRLVVPAWLGERSGGCFCCVRKSEAGLRDVVCVCCITHVSLCTGSLLIVGAWYCCLSFSNLCKGGLVERDSCYYVVLFSCRDWCFHVHFSCRSMSGSTRGAGKRFGLWWLLARVWAGRILVASFRCIWTNENIVLVLPIRALTQI